MKFLITIWFLLLSLTLNAQTIKGCSENCVIYLTIENQETSHAVKSIDIQFSSDGLNFISFDVANPKIAKQEYVCTSKVTIAYFRTRTIYGDGRIVFSNIIKIKNECDLLSLL